MKRIIALFLAVLTVFAASCTKAQPSGGSFEPTGSAEPTAEQTTERPSVTVEPTPAVPETTAPAVTEEETESPEDKQAFYEELFRKKDIRFAGKSMWMETAAEGVEMTIRYETAGDDSMMLMLNSSTKKGFGVYNVGGKRYLYGNIVGSEISEGGEYLYVIDDPGFTMGEEDRPDFEFDEVEGSYRIGYLGTQDGLDRVLYTVPEEEGTMCLYFDGDANIVRIEVETADPEEPPVSVDFRDVQKITLPDNVTAQEVGAAELGVFAIACMLSLMPENGGEDPGPEPTAEPTTEVPVVIGFDAAEDLVITEDSADSAAVFTFLRLPARASDIEDCIGTYGLEAPENAAAFFIASIHAFGYDPEAGEEMISLLMDSESSFVVRQFIMSQLREKPYLCEAYFMGVDLVKTEKAEAPFVVKVSKQPGGEKDETLIKVWTDAVPNDRTVVLLEKDGEYRLSRCPSLLMSMGDKAY